MNMRREMEMLAALPPWEWPGDAAGTILARLRDRGGDAQERVLAAELAGDLVVMNDALAGALLGVLGDAGEESSLRQAAAIAFGPVLEEVEWHGFDDPDVPAACSRQVVRRIREALAALYRDAEAPRDLRRRALEASVRGQESWHAGAVRAAWHDQDPLWRMTSVFCMGSVKGFEDEVLEALSSDDPALLYEAVRTAGRAGIRRAWPRVCTLLLSGDTEKDLLLAAIEAAGEIGERDEAAEALENLVDTGDEEIAVAAADAMSELDLWAALGEEGFDEEEFDEED